MDAYDLITRNVSEVVTENEVHALADDPEGKRAYVGYEPSGILHIGHMLIVNRPIGLQAVGSEVVVLLADTYAYLNGEGTLEEIRETAERMKAQFIAYGPSESQTEFVPGSEYQPNEDRVLDLHATEPEMTLSRAERVMAEIKSDGGVTVTQVAYPVMQVLDIICPGVDLAIDGMEQREVHMLARDTFPSIGEESPTCMHTPLIADLGTGIGRMSPSEGATISMEDSMEDVKDKANSAFCPPTVDPEPADEDEERENPVLQIFKHRVFPRFERAVVERPEQYDGNLDYDDYETLEADLGSGGLHPANAKGALADYLDELTKPSHTETVE